MTTVSSAASEPSRESLFRLPRLPWPPGTTLFIFRTWVALAIAYYAAFFLELEGASSAGICVLILAQPTQGMVLSKSIYRLAATLIGVSVAVILTALFPQDRTMLLAAFAIIMALQTALGSILRDFRSYACILGGYTIAIVSIQDIDAPMSVFSGAVNRVAAIVVGIVAVAISHSFLASAESSKSLSAKLRAATKEAIAMALGGDGRACATRRLDLHRDERQADAAAQRNQLRDARKSKRARSCQGRAKRASRPVRNDLGDPSGRLGPVACRGFIRDYRPGADHPTQGLAHSRS